MRCGIATEQAEVEKPNGQALNPAIRCEARGPWRQQMTWHEEHVLTRVANARAEEVIVVAGAPDDAPGTPGAYGLSHRILPNRRGYPQRRRRAQHRPGRRCREMRQASDRSARRPVDCGSGRAGFLRCPRSERPAAYSHIRAARRLSVQACLASAIAGQDHADHRPGPQVPATPIRPAKPAVARLVTSWTSRKRCWSRRRHKLCVIAGQTASFRRILPLKMPLRGETLIGSTLEFNF